jgi:RNA polymerase sigma-70 factor (ECF subfamily)
VTPTGRLVEWFTKLRKRTRTLLRRGARVVPTKIDDLAQEVFLRLQRYSDNVAVENPQGYLFRIASNVANEWRDRSHIGQSHNNAWLDELEIESSEQIEDAVARRRAQQYLRSVVDQLPPRQREILLLHVNEGLTYKQIAERRGLTYDIVLRDLALAYSEIRMQLKIGED